VVLGSCWKPRWSQEAPKRPQKAPKRPQEAPKRHPKRRPRASKRRPRATQEAPKAFQEIGNLKKIASKTHYCFEHASETNSLRFLIDLGYILGLKRHVFLVRLMVDIECYDFFKITLAPAREHDFKGFQRSKKL